MRLTGGVLTGLVLLGSIGTSTASAATVTCESQWAAWVAHPTVDTARAVGYCEIDRRLADLATVRVRVQDARNLTSSDRSHMEQTIDATRTGLRHLRSEIAGDSTVATLRPDLQAIVDDYRVYVLVIRQDWLTYAADNELAAVRAFTAFDARVGDWIAKAKAAGYDTSVVEASRAAMEADVAQVKTAVTPLPASLLALTPAQYDAGTAGPAMDRAAATLRDELQMLADARVKATAIVAAIRAYDAH